LRKTGSLTAILPAEPSANNASPVAYASETIAGSWLQPPSARCSAARDFASSRIADAGAPPQASPSSLKAWSWFVTGVAFSSQATERAMAFSQFGFSASGA
jgi:hypothetical protein